MIFYVQGWPELYTFGRAGLGGMCVWWEVWANIHLDERAWEVCAFNLLCPGLAITIYIWMSGLGRYVRMVGGMCVHIHSDERAWEVCAYGGRYVRPYTFGQVGLGGMCV